VQSGDRRTFKVSVLHESQIPDGVLAPISPKCEFCANSSAQG